MIHTIHTMTVDMYSEIESTKNIKLFKKRYNLLPLALFKTRINKIFDFVSTVMGNSNSIDREKYRIITYNRILQLSNLYNDLHAILVTKIKNDILKEYIGKKTKSSKNLKYIIDEVKRLTDIKIESVKDLKRLEKEIQRRTDKYLETFNQKKEDTEQVTFIQLALGVFAIMEMPYDGNMKLYTFGKLKEMAINKSRKLENARNKRNSK